MDKCFDIQKYTYLFDRDFALHYGKVTKVVGLTIESIGPACKLGDLCEIRSRDGKDKVRAEVVGFKDSKVLLMPFDVVDGIGLGAMVKKSEAKRS